MQTEITKKKFTVEEYYNMDEVCILPRDVHTELIEGEIFKMLKTSLSCLVFPDIQFPVQELLA